MVNLKCNINNFGLPQDDILLKRAESHGWLLSLSLACLTTVA
jgi:hypothetical protein